MSSSLRNLSQHLDQALIGEHIEGLELHGDLLRHFEAYCHRDLGAQAEWFADDALRLKVMNLTRAAIDAILDGRDLRALARG